MRIEFFLKLISEELRRDRALKYLNSHGLGIPYLHGRLEKEPVIKEGDGKAKGLEAKRDGEWVDATVIAVDGDLYTVQFDDETQLGLRRSQVRKPPKWYDLLDKSAWADSQTYYGEVFPKKFTFKPEQMDYQGNFIVDFKNADAAKLFDVKTSLLGTVVAQFPVKVLKIVEKDGEKNRLETQYGDARGVGGPNKKLGQTTGFFRSRHSGLS